MFKETMDPAKRRQQVRSIISEKNVEKFLKSGKSEKDKYYEKYVE